MYTQIKNPEDGKTQSMPLSNYHWLIGNPVFPGIPAGYVIHHLDQDPMNDDISNLALMAKNHHRAYHLKYKNCDIPIENDIEIDNNSSLIGFPVKRPKAYYRKDINRWVIRYYMRTPTKTKHYQINRYRDNQFFLQEHAEKAIDKIWPQFHYTQVTHAT